MTNPAPEFLALQAAVAGRFSLDSELGRGGMGVVFLARDVRLERWVAIKLLAPHLAASPEMRRRFLREARTAASCFHPHIVPIHAVEEAGDLAYFVMAFVRGETLAERLARVGSLPADVVRRIGREIGWALAYAHERGVVHRDVKPANILLEDGTDRALIADFGIALQRDVATPVPDVAGTARFMAPEQALGEPVDGRADLYALGVTLYLAASGRYPHDGANAVAVLAQQTRAAAPSLRFAGTAVPEGLADAIDRCLAREPDARFRDAAAFVAAIDAPAPVTFSPGATAVAAHAAASRSLLGWSVAGAATTTLVALGESSLGQVIIESIGGSAVLVVAALAAVRGAEALLTARRAVQGGTSGDEIADALVGAGPASGAPPARSRRTLGASQLMLGSVLALQEGRIGELAWLPEAVGTPLEIALIIAPLILIARGGASVLRGSRLARTVRERIALPLARAGARLVGGVFRRRPVVVETAHTELQLDRAADAIIARLPQRVQADLHDVPRAVNALAAEVARLRALDSMLADRERAARGATGPDGRQALDAVLAGRAEVQGRIGTTIAMLESVRLDLLRVEQGELAADGLTTHLDAVRALQHRVDAAAEVQRLLNAASRAPAANAIGPMDATPA